jgi:hypothetical protein
MRGQMTFKVSGLKTLGDDIKLENFIVKVGNKAEVNLGTCTTAVSSAANTFPSDEPLGDDKYTAIGKDVYEAITSGNKRVQVVVKFKPSVELATASQVYLEIKVVGKYIYNTYPK